MLALVVDDSRAMRRIVSAIVGPLGFTPVEADNGASALAELERLTAEGTVPALACIDWNMPVMDGLQLVQAVRSDPRWRGVTLMMVTTESEHSQIVRALAAGAHEYLIKPFTADALADKLRYLGLVPAEVGA
ncbi:response regulator [Aquipuribacter nitratireducens]|uniref:Response regulator n=1 Tax=Aquipuribacter nitratireducens TaxID=650104 RepID=A0ABW0GPH8_9MICO